jgi:hypothetical protein
MFTSSTCSLIFETVIWFCSYRLLASICSLTCPFGQQLSLTYLRVFTLSDFSEIFILEAACIDGLLDL